MYMKNFEKERWSQIMELGSDSQARELARLARELSSVQWGAIAIYGKRWFFF